MSQLEKIMLVEDEPDVRTITRMALESTADFDLVVCSDGLDAWNHLRHNDVQLVLLDVMMPRMDGPSLVERLEAEGRLESMAVIFLTARASSSEVERFHELGALDVIEKPFDPMGLADRVHTLWEKHRVGQ